MTSEAATTERRPALVDRSENDVAESAVSDPSAYEAEHVHAVYEEIASHFSATRYKPWPIVSRFLAAREPGSVGLDVGCGNGKYFGTNPAVFLIGSDRSTELTRIAAARVAKCKTTASEDRDGIEANKHMESRKASKATKSVSTVSSFVPPESADGVVADSLALPHPPGRFDFAISVAVVHHFATKERRVAAVRELLEALKLEKAATKGSSVGSEGGAATEAEQEEPGQVLICVWALEQKGSRRGWDTGMAQDVLVPWVLKERSKVRPGSKDETGDADSTGDGVQIESGASESSRAQEQGTSSGNGTDSPKETFQRYYHLYREGELKEDVRAAGGVVLAAGYEADNWWVIATRGWV